MGDFCLNKSKGTSVKLNATKLLAIVGGDTGTKEKKKETKGEKKPKYSNGRVV